MTALKMRPSLINSLRARARLHPGFTSPLCQLQQRTYAAFEKKVPNPANVQNPPPPNPTEPVGRNQFWHSTSNRIIIGGSVLALGVAYFLMTGSPDKAAGAEDRVERSLAKGRREVTSAVQGSGADAEAQPLKESSGRDMQKTPGGRGLGSYRKE